LAGDTHDLHVVECGSSVMRL